MTYDQLMQYLGQDSPLLSMGNTNPIDGIDVGDSTAWDLSVPQDDAGMIGAEQEMTEAEALAQGAFARDGWARYAGGPGPGTNDYQSVYKAGNLADLQKRIMAARRQQQWQPIDTGARQGALATYMRGLLG